MTAAKIAHAAQATDAIQEQVIAAHNHLEAFNGRILNGWGVYAEPWALRAALKVAKVSIDAAWEVMARTPWPTDEDYPGG